MGLHAHSTAAALHGQVVMCREIDSESFGTHICGRRVPRQAPPAGHEGQPAAPRDGEGLQAHVGPEASVVGICYGGLHGSAIVSLTACMSSAYSSA